MFSKENKDIEWEGIKRKKCIKFTSFLKSQKVPEKASPKTTWVTKSIQTFRLLLKFIIEVYAFSACSSVKPIVPIAGWENTTVAMVSYTIPVFGSPPKSRSASRRPAAIATGVSSYPVVVTSPIAKIPVSAVATRI